MRETVLALIAEKTGYPPEMMELWLIELCFQTAGIGELGTSGRMALPLKVAISAISAGEEGA